MISSAPAAAPPPSSSRRAAAVTAAAMVAAVLAGPAGARDAPARTWSEMRGAGTAAAAGDVNGDGHPDVVLSRGGLVQPPRGGRTWVVFGPWAKGRVTAVTRLGHSGFVIESATDYDLADESAGAGDVNGDGLDDVIVGAPGGGTGDREGNGAAYVVFGRREIRTVDLGVYEEGAQQDGFRIDGPSVLSLTGWSVSTAGDVNGDGLADVIVAAPFAGSAYVVFGKTSTQPVDLGAFDLNAQGPAGYRIDFPAPDSSDGVSVAGGGDVNGDGLDDVVVGHIPDAYESPGSAFVVFGKPTPDPVDVRALGPRGFAIAGRADGDTTGYSVAVGGDVNGDGFADVAVGIPRAYHHVQGRAAVVFGAAVPTDVRVDDLGERGFLIGWGRDGENAGQAVAIAGDVNSDGLDDAVVGAQDASRNGLDYSGSVYVVYGRTDVRRVDLDRLRRQGGFRVDGIEGAPRRCDRPDWGWCPGDWLGSSVSGLDDVTGDGKGDLLVGAFAAGGHRLGRSYVLRGR